MKEAARMCKLKIAFILNNAHANHAFVPGALVRLDSILNVYDASGKPCATNNTLVPVK